MSPLLEPVQTTKKHTTTRIIFLALGLLAAAFLGLVGYYTWVLRYGDASALRQEFSPQFTAVSQERPSSAKPVSREEAGAVIRPHNPILGAPKAPVTIIAYIDFECPYSRESYPILKDIADTYAGAARVVFKHFPIAAIHPESVAAANAAACAHAQNKFWPYHDLLFIKKELDTQSLRSYAQSLGLSMPAFERCAAGSDRYADIETDVQDGLLLGVRGTPTFFVNGTRIEGVVDRKTWDAVILGELRKK